MNARRFLCLIPLAGLLGLLAACSTNRTPVPTLTPRQATIIVTFDMGGGRSGFTASIYAQDVYSGKTVSHPYSNGSHGGVVLPSEPISFTVDAPGTYIFYGNLINAPESYHYGSTGCPPATNCASTALLAIQVVPGQTYAVTISDRSAPVPTPHAPVTVPWRLAPTPTP